MQIPSIPFKILALAPFTPQQGMAWSDDPIRIDKTNLDEVIARMGVSLHIPIPKDLCPAGGLDITCGKLKDFHPDGLAKSNAFLKNLLDAKTFVEDAKEKGLSLQEIGAKLKEWPDLPPIDLKTEHKEAKRAPTSAAVDSILDLIALPADEPSQAVETHSLTGQLDLLLRQILKHALSYESFRNLEAVWHGVKFLLKQGGMNGEISLEIAPVSFETLDETLDNLTTRLVHDLPSLVIVDLPFDNSPRSLESLEKIAQFAETLLSPTVCWITQKFLHIDSWQELNKLPFLPHYFEEAAFAKWRRLRKDPSAKWLVITCNRFLARYPYGPDNKPRSVYFEEEPRALWTSPVWALGCLMGQSFARTGWPSRFTDWQETRLEDLALNMKDTHKPVPTETHFAEDRIHQFVSGGIMPLVASSKKDIAFMPLETTVAGSSLGYQAFVSRITQFVLWCKDNLTGTLEPADLRKDLEKAFSSFFEKSGHATPKNLEISTGRPDSDDRIPVKITIEPSRQVLPSRETVELEFSW